MNPAISIISPVYREGAFIGKFLNAVEKEIQSTGEAYEIILVDDGSPDDSWEHIRREASQRSHVRCLRFSRNFGKEAALTAGIDTAKGDAIITLDSDLQHPPSLIPQMISAWRNNTADIIEAQKTQRQSESQIDRFLVHLFYAFFTWASSYNLNGASDFKLLDRKVVEAWKLLPERKVFFRGMTAWVGFKHLAIPFAPIDRAEGQTKWSFIKKLRLALDSLTAYTAKPLALIWILTLLFFCFSILVGAEALWTKLSGQAMTGFTTVILLILITGTAILFSLCLLSVYIRQIFYEVKRRPRYLIGETYDSPDNQ